MDHAPSPKRLVWLLLRDPEDLESAGRGALGEMLEASTDIAMICPLIQRFKKMVKNTGSDGQIERLDCWLQEALASDVRDFESGSIRSLPKIRYRCRFSATSSGPEKFLPDSELRICSSISSGAPLLFALSTTVSLLAGQSMPSRYWCRSPGSMSLISITDLSSLAPPGFHCIAGIFTGAS